MVAIALNETLPSPSPTQTTLARLVGVGKTYGSGETAVAALSNATLDIRAGEVTLIEGPSDPARPRHLDPGLSSPRPRARSGSRQERRRPRREAAPRAARAQLRVVFQASTCSRPHRARERRDGDPMKDPKRRIRRRSPPLLELVGLGPRLHHLPPISRAVKSSASRSPAPLGGNHPPHGDEPTAALDTKTALSVMDLFATREHERARGRRRHARPAPRALRGPRRPRRGRLHPGNRFGWRTLMNTKLRYALLALPVAAGSFLWCGRDTKPASAQPALTARPAILVAPGRVEPERDAVKLAFEAQGRIVEILVDEGAAVKANQILARLDDRMPRARVTAAGPAREGQGPLHVRPPWPRLEDSPPRAPSRRRRRFRHHRTAEQARSEQLGRSAPSPTRSSMPMAPRRRCLAQAKAQDARYASLARVPPGADRRGRRLDRARAAELDAAQSPSTRRSCAPRRTASSSAATPRSAPSSRPNPIPHLSPRRNSAPSRIRAEIDEATSPPSPPACRYATAEATASASSVRITRISHELGARPCAMTTRGPRRHAHPRGHRRLRRQDGVELPLGLRMAVHVGK